MMPKLGGKKYAYTAKGMAQYKKDKKKTTKSKEKVSIFDFLPDARQRNAFLNRQNQKLQNY